MRCINNNSDVIVVIQSQPTVPLSEFHFFFHLTLTFFLKTSRPAFGPV